MPADLHRGRAIRPTIRQVRYGDYLMERLNKNYDYRKPEAAPAAGM